MKGFYRLQLMGAALQVAAFSSALVQNLVVPRLLGAEAYGRAVFLLTLPLLVQALAEPVVQTITLRYAANEPGRLILLARHLGAAAGLGAAATALYVLRGAGPVEMAAAVAVALVSAATTLLTAAAYATRRISILLRLHAVALVSILAGIFALRGRGALTLVAATLFMHVAGSLSLYFSADVRRIACGRAAAPAAGWKLWSEYLTCLSPRASTLLLTSGSLLVAATLLAPRELAGFRLDLSLINAGVYAFPLSSPVLQATLVARPDEEPHRPLALLLALRFLVCALPGLVLFLFGPLLKGLFFGADFAATPTPALFLALPFFALLDPLAAVLQARREESGLRRSLAACSAGFLLGALGGAAAAFIGGAVCAAAASAVAVWRRPLLGRLVPPELPS
jgi:hypothetical protein